MKTNKILTLISVTAVMLLSSCVKEITTQNPYVRNTGEEIIVVSADTLAFPGRGTTLTFTASTTYDATIVAPEWLTLTSSEIPGDGRDFTVSATAEANTGKDGATDRSGVITISSRTLSETIYVNQPIYVRPDCPMIISSVDEFRDFIEICLPYYEADEVVEFAADINLEGVTLNQSTETFKGILNGNGFRIKNWKGSAALFAINRGVINNLVIDESCSVTVPDASAEVYVSPFVAKNYGTISGCVNNALVLLNGNYTQKTYIGGIAAYHYDGAAITSCVNKGEIRYAVQSATGNAYIGGIAGYSYGSVTNCETYGQINGLPVSFSAVYWVGGITPRHQTGDLTGNIVHKEARIYTNKIAKNDKSYFGGIAGYVELAPKTADNQMYADIEVNIESTKDIYVGGLQGFQGKVDDASMPSANMFEGSIVNSNITAYISGKGTNGNNPCFSAGFVTGRFSGQSGKATTLHYGTADKQIKVSGSIICLQTGTKKVAAAKDYQAMLDGDGSKTSVNLGAIPECDYGNIIYKVCGDGQTGDAEDLVVRTEKVNLTVESTGGETKFSVRGNYTMTVTPEVDWITADVETVAGDGEYHEITLTAVANDHTYDRKGTVAVTMPMGSTEIVTVAQGGNKTLPESLEVSVESINADPAGMETSSFKVTLNYDATLTPSADWIAVDPVTLPGDEAQHTVVATFAKNQSGAARQGTITIALPKGLTKTITVNQDKFVYVPKAEISTAADFLDFMVYGNDPQLYPSTFEVKLTADIDLKGKTVGMIDSFAGNIDGQGHSLKNIKSDVPLFGQNAGTVKNIILDGSCSFALDPDKAPTNGSAIWTGALCGNIISGGTVIGCTNKASVTMTKNSAVQVFVGGIAGRSNADVTVDGCVNEGSIIIKPSSAVNGIEYRVAGVVAGCNGTITNCVNNAPVEYSPADLSGKGFYLGGVVSYLTAQPMKNCINKQKGTVTFNPVTYSGSTQSYIGGLIGYVDKKTTVSECGNFGDVTVTGNHETLATGGLTGYVKAGAAGFILFDGCSVNCNVTAVTPAAGVTASTNPLMSAGLVIGRVAQKSGTDNVTCQVGTPEAPCKTAGSITVLGGASSTADASNYTNYLFGNSLTSNFFNSGSAKLNAVNCIYEAVTKE